MAAPYEAIMLNRRVFVGVGIGDQNKDGVVDVQPVGVLRVPVVDKVVAVELPAINVPVAQVAAVASMVLGALPAPASAAIRPLIGMALGALGMLAK